VAASSSPRATASAPRAARDRPVSRRERRPASTEREEEGSADASASERAGGALGRARARRADGDAEHADVLAVRCLERRVAERVVAPADVLRAWREPPARTSPATPAAARVRPGAALGVEKDDVARPRPRG
jgi:hypothetical protein